MGYYVYHVEILPTNEYYYGARYSKTASPSDLGKKYFTSSTLVQQKLFEHGSKNCKFSIIAEYNTKEECSKHENSLIIQHMSNPLCLNKDRKTFGKGYKHSKEAKQKISQAVKNHWKDPALRAKKIKANTGRTWKLSEEKRKKVSEANKNKFTSKTAAVCKGTKWINNGKINKRIPSSYIIPEGFVLGRKLSK